MRAGRATLSSVPLLTSRDRARELAEGGLVGRDAELDLLRSAATRAQQGRAVTVLVQGESGVGKTALVRSFAGGLPADVLILAGRCSERESSPYRAFEGVARGLLRHLGKLPPEEAVAILPRRPALLARAFPVLAPIIDLAGVPERELDSSLRRGGMFAAMRELLLRLRDRRPLVLVIDDLQWADADSLGLLAELMRPPEAPALLLLATVRTGDAHAAERLALPGEVRRLPLGSLPMRDACELAEQLLRSSASRGAPALSAEALAREAGGHPLFLGELVRYAADHGDGPTPAPALTASGARARAPAPPLPGQPPTFRLEQALWSRMSRLPALTRRVLALTAVAGEPLRHTVLAAAAELELGDLLRVIAELSDAHLSRSTGIAAHDTVEPYHDRVRAALLFHLDEDTRLDCHRRVAQALADDPGADPEALAVHWEAAGDAELAARHAVAAGLRAADAFAFDRAARLLQQALDWAPLAGAQGRELRLRLGEALASAGRGRAAGEVYLAASVGAPREQSIDLMRRAADQYLRSGYLDDGMAVLVAVLRAVGLRLAPTPGRALASLLWKRARLRVRGLGFTERREAEVPVADLIKIDACGSVAVGLAMIDTIRSTDFQTLQLLLALRAGEPYRICRAMATEAVLASVGHGGKRKRAEVLLARAQQLADKVGEPRATGYVPFAAGVSRYLAGHWRDGLRLCEHAESILRECSDVSWELYNARFYALLARFQLGQLGDFVRLTRAERVAADERGDIYAAFTLRLGLAVVPELVDDAPGRARQEVAATMQRLPQGQFQLQQYQETIALAQLAQYEGDGAAALAVLDARWAEIARSLILRVQYIRIEALALRARSALMAGLLERAARDVRKLEGEGLPWSRALAQLLHAALLLARGERAEASTLLTAAEQGFGEAEMAMYACIARRAHGLVSGGDAGAALVAAAESWLRGQGVVAPAPFCRVFAPGFDAAR